MTYDISRLYGWPVVNAEAEIGMDHVEQTCVDQHSCSGGSLLCRLEYKIYRSAELAVHSCLLKEKNAAQKRSGMEIVTASVHDPRIYGFPGALIFLCLRQCIDICPKHDFRTVAGSLHPGEDACL